MNTEEIENILRQAPRPVPTATLKERLIEQIDVIRPATSSYRATPRSGHWLRRWWPALSPATVSLACAVVFTMQQLELHDLKQAVAALPQVASPSNHTQSKSTSETATAAVDPVDRQEQEIARLKQRAAILEAELARLEQMRGDNTRLRAQLAALPERLTAEETQALGQARRAAEEIACVNNLKQLGLAARVWATDNNDCNPPDILSMTNELSTPKLLVCPADTARQLALNWASYTAANCSYEYLPPQSRQPDREPQRVLFRCPIHGSVTLCDGSVQKAVGKEHPDWLVSRGGQLYFEPHPSDPGSADQTTTAPNVPQQ